MLSSLFLRWQDLHGTCCDHAVGPACQFSIASSDSNLALAQSGKRACVVVQKSVLAIRRMPDDDASIVVRSGHERPLRSDFVIEKLERVSTAITDINPSAAGGRYTDGRTAVQPEQALAIFPFPFFRHAFLLASLCSSMQDLVGQSQQFPGLPVDGQ